MTPDNYKQSFTDDFKQEESCKIFKKKKKKRYLKLDKKNHVILQRVLYKHVHKYHNCKCQCIITIHIHIYNSMWYN